MTAEQAISQLASNTGCLYATAPDGTTILSSEVNTNSGYAKMKHDAVWRATLAGNTRGVATIDISAVVGVGLQLTVLTIDGLSQIGGAVNLTNGDVTASAGQVATAVNSYVAATDYTALSILGTVYLFPPTTGSDYNGDVVIATFDPGVTATNTDVYGGTTGSDPYDSKVGRRYWINPTSSADPVSLTGAIEVTQYFLNRGFQSSQIVETISSFSGSKFTVDRTASMMQLILDTGGVGYIINNIVNAGAQIGDILTLSGFNAGSSVTIQVGGNIYLKNSADFNSGVSEETLVLRWLDDDTNGLGWYEVTRSPGLPAQVSAMRGINIPQSPNGITTVTLTSPNQVAHTETIVIGTDSHRIRVVSAGVVTLTGNYAIVMGGTPIEGDEFWVSGNNFAVTLGAFTFTVQGVSIYQELMTTGQWGVLGRYQNGAWVAALTPDFTGTQFILNDQIVDATIDLDAKGLPASITTGLYAPLSVDNAAMAANSVDTINVVDGSITTAKLDATLQSTLGCVYCVKVTMVAATINNSFTVPVSLVPAQGAGTYIVPIFVQGFYQAGATAFTLAGAGFDIYVNGAANIAFSNNFAVTLLADAWYSGQIAAQDLTNGNQGLFIAADTGDPTLGDGSLTIWITYKVLTP